MQDLAVSTSISFFTAEDLKNAFIEENGFLAAMKKNRGKPAGSAVCVVDPAIVDCQNMGFAAFLLYTLDHIMLCRAFGIDRPTVFWKACNSVCSGIPEVHCFGVHVRGTDHWMETSEQRLPPLMSWVERAQSILETLPRPRKIFIASDNNEVIKKFVTYFGKETLQLSPNNVIGEQMQDLAVSTSIPLLTVEDLKNAFIKGYGFLATMKKNRGKPAGSAVCVVDPAVTDCTNMGFAALLLSTLENILLCRALGIDRPIVHWRACNSVCSEDPRVNSWDWYFETVNHGLESKVENVLCPLKVLDGWQERLNRTALSDVKTVIDNSFKNRTDVGDLRMAK
ncbi:hypothetical protein OS493_036489 [Desmophyllum pertusum]|uniref:Uncharacterized protein n=1 Tax=Desmophyllum pertusum TaxID=174260 RepID=A0A9W9ZVI3_9CNID|nr:hypothetical protein OS493_036489 [Desmophyllum pertusum]